ncbi:MAG: hypothetical protein EOP48_04865 [Sphingobacteriales bacterium]|nr:MAG: hypothetical protein EOP48_04865 [Sphingobacteriales bacterium]
MKYHYQFVSRTTVRIELIAEDKKEISLLENFDKLKEENDQLFNLYQKGLESYDLNVKLSKLKFMSFPKVALCSYSAIPKTAVENPYIEPSFI